MLVDVGQATFVSFSGGKLSIKDLADEEVITGTYTISVALSDVEAETLYSIKIVIQPAFAVEIVEIEVVDEPSADGEDSQASPSSNSESSSSASSSDSEI